MKRFPQLASDSIEESERFLPALKTESLKALLSRSLCGNGKETKHPTWRPQGAATKSLFRAVRIEVHFTAWDAVLVLVHKF